MYIVHGLSCMDSHFNVEMYDVCVECIDHYLLGSNVSLCRIFIYNNPPLSCIFILYKWRIYFPWWWERYCYVQTFMVEKWFIFYKFLYETFTVEWSKNVWNAQIDPKLVPDKKCPKSRTVHHWLNLIGLMIGL